jgi:colanic acid/amylovoran biosynthesis glycosyltransferase
MPQVNRVAYLAPEFPALSATFVTNEVMALQNRGVAVFPFSVHRPKSPAKVKTESPVTVLYETSTGKLLGNLGLLLLQSPLRFMRTVGMVFGDVFAAGAAKIDSWKLLYQFLSAALLARCMTALKVEHLHVHFGHVPTQIAMYASAFSGIPFSFTMHANDIFERGLLLDRKVRRAKGAVTISEYNRHYLAGLGIPESDVSIVRCGVSLPSQLRTEPSQTETFRIGTLGRLVEKKGFDLAVKAVAELKNQLPVVRLELAGDGPLATALDTQIRESSLGETVVRIGSLENHQVKDWMQTLDLFVLPCRTDSNGDRDGIPVVLMEAMAAGIPVISTRLSGIPELIHDGESGLLVEEEDSQFLARQMYEVYSDPENTKRLAENARRRIETEFEQERNIDRLQQIFEKGSKNAQR